MNRVTKEFGCVAGKVKVHGMVTGKLAIKRSAMSSERPGTWSTLLSFRDKEYGALLPVWTWVVEHPEANFLIDTGLTSSIVGKSYFEGVDWVSKYYLEKQMLFDVNREDEIDRQLEKIGLSISSIDKVVLTHLHIDHTDGLKYFPNKPVLVNEQEWKTHDGSFPVLFPPNIKVEQLKLKDNFENFEHSSFLTKDKSLIFVETPGHTRGHSSIVLKTKNCLVLFAGDITYTQDRLLSKVFSATIKDKKQSIKTCEEVIRLSKKNKVIYLPTHDSENASRLLHEITL